MPHVVQLRWFIVPVLAACVMSGCAQTGGDGEAPPPPTQAAIERIRTQTQQPAYWLGPRFQGLAIARATATRRGVTFSYGRWTCDSGCSPPEGVGTLPKREVRDLDGVEISGAGPRRCWSQVGRAVAVLLGCRANRYEQQMRIYSGRRQINLASLYTADGTRDLDVRLVLAGLRPLNANAPWPLPPPARLSCAELRRVDRRYRPGMPAALRPRPACPGAVAFSR